MRSSSVGRGLVLLVGALAIMLGAIVAVSPVAAVGLILFAAIQISIVTHRASAAYIYAAIFPLTVGIDRGAALAVLRPNEALLLVLWIALIISFLAKGELPRPMGGIQKADVAFFALAVMGSFYSLGGMYFRGVAISSDDVVYSVVLWKLFAVYLLGRVALRERTEFVCTAKIIVGVAFIVSLVGFAQVSGVGSVVSVLSSVWSDADPLSDGASELRASSTIGAPIPFADFMAVSSILAFTFSFFYGSRLGKLFARGAAVLFAVGCLASGQVSGVLALALMILALGAFTGQFLRYLAILIGVGLVASFALGSVISARIDQIDTRTGLPAAWTGTNGRLANLENFVLPRIAEGSNLLFGVRTSSRIAATETWREWIYIESGYALLVWVGGVPMLLVFAALLWELARCSNVLLHREGLSRAFGQACATVVTLLAILMIFDPHLTYRGSSDLIGIVLAMSVSCAGSMAGLKDQSEEESSSVNFGLSLAYAGHASGTR